MKSFEVKWEVRELGLSEGGKEHPHLGTVVGKGEVIKQVEDRAAIDLLIDSELKPLLRANFDMSGATWEREIHIKVLEVPNAS